QAFARPGVERHELQRPRRFRALRLHVEALLQARHVAAEQGGEACEHAAQFRRALQREAARLLAFALDTHGFAAYRSVFAIRLAHVTIETPRPGELQLTGDDERFAQQRRHANLGERDACGRGARTTRET